MFYFTILTVLAVSLILSFAAVALILKLSHAKGWFDRTDHRTVHEGDIPRLGGIGFAAVLLISAAVICFLFQDNESLKFYLPCIGALLLILVFGVIDDFIHLAPGWKLLAQVAAALIVIISGHVFNRVTYFDTTVFPQFINYAITFFWIVGITNAINLIDGIDGLAGSISGLIALFFGLIFFYTSNDPILILFCVAFVGSVAGFLIFNAPLPKAKIFMGDCGSQFLGFSIALLPLLAEKTGLIAMPLLYAVALLLIPIIDTIAAIWRRIRDGQRIDTPDKAHVHHKLMNLGFSVRGSLAVLCGLQIVIGLIVFISIRFEGLLSIYILSTAYFTVTAFFTIIHYKNRAVLNNEKICPFKGIILKLPAPLIIIAITILSSQSTLPQMPGVFGFDKFLHFVAYAALAVAVGLWFTRESWQKQPNSYYPVRNFFICVAIASIYGAIDEFHQYFVPGRSCDIWDWVADTLGGVAGAAFVMISARVYERLNKAKKLGTM